MASEEAASQAEAATDTEVKQVTQQLDKTKRHLDQVNNEVISLYHNTKKSYRNIQTSKLTLKVKRKLFYRRATQCQSITSKLLTV